MATDNGWWSHTDLGRGSRGGGFRVSFGLVKLNAYSKALRWRILSMPRKVGNPAPSGAEGGCHVGQRK
jgi:hypothetical protein